jgi:hypothetical protein
MVDGTPVDGAVRVPPGARVRIGRTILRLGAVQPAPPTARPPAADGGKSSAGLVVGVIVMGLMAWWSWWVC